MEIKRYLSIICKNPLFSEKDTLENIVSEISLLNGKISEYEKGEILHRSGERFRFFGLVLSGACRAVIDDIEGNRTIMAEVLPGTTFGEALCFLKVENPDVYMEASSDMEVLWLSPENLFTDNPTRESVKMQKRFTAMVASRTLLMNNRIQILSKLTLRDKLITYFTFLVRENGKTEFSLPFNREDMATYMGTNRSALSRELSKMKSEGVLDYKKNKFILKI